MRRLIAVVTTALFFAMACTGNDADADGDGVRDADDKCPHFAEDPDGLGDWDGCPEQDQDRDGYLDTVDACPYERGGEPDGCRHPGDDDPLGVELGPPESLFNSPGFSGLLDWAREQLPSTKPKDSDKDGIADEVDRCDDQPETPNGFEDSDGCPDAPPATTSDLPTRVARHPRVNAPAGIAQGESFTLNVSLTEAAYQPTVESGATLDEEAAWREALRVDDGQRTSDGALALALEAPAAKGWTLEVVIQAPSFSVERPEQRRCPGDERLRRCIRLPVTGDSEVASFELTLRTAPPPGALPVVYTQFWFEGRVLAEVSRAFVVEGEEELSVAEPQRAPEPADEEDAVTLSSPEDEASLRVLFGQASNPQREATHWVVVSRATGSKRLWGSEWEPQEDLARLVSEWYPRFSKASRGGGDVPSALLDDATLSPSGSLVSMTLETFGRRLWDLHVPELVKEHLRLAHERGELTSIAIETVDPDFPWELVKPYWGGPAGYSGAKGRVELPFLGTLVRIGRWPKEAMRQAQLRKEPPLLLPLGPILALTPTYDRSPLNAVERERTAIDKAFGVCPLSTTGDELARELARLSGGLLHFAGHGNVRYSKAGAPPQYGLRLSDAETLYPLNWEAMSHDWPPGVAPLVFFNACELGQEDISLGGYGQGWPSAVLRSGAAGYIGALWPVGDEGAATFAAAFYAEVDSMLDTGEPAYVAEALRRVRAELYGKTQNPTYMAYVFYGDPNARFVRAEDSACPQ